MYLSACSRMFPFVAMLQQVVSHVARAAIRCIFSSLGRYTKVPEKWVGFHSQKLSFIREYLWTRPASHGARGQSVPARGKAAQSVERRYVLLGRSGLHPRPNAMLRFIGNRRASNVETYATRTVTRSTFPA